MKITRITLQNFRAFRGNVPLDVDLGSGKNLLVFGENGSGKTSLFLALNDFLEASDKALDISDTPFRNLFAEPADETFVNLKFSDGDDYKWSITNAENQTADIRVVNKTKGFIDYKKLLQTYFLQQEERSVNVFGFFVETLIANSFNDTGSWTFGDKWDEINREIQKLNHARQSETIQELITEFNGGLTVKIAEIEVKAQSILELFYKENLTIKIRFGGVDYPASRKDRIKTGKNIENQIINLSVDFYTKQEANHHQFLNEAKLSAVALSVYLASLPVTKDNAPRLIALDDVLIGLDMANRLPILNILENHFPNDQIFFFTYDRAWFEIVKSRVQNKWKVLEFFTSKTDELELPIVQDSKTYIEKANAYYNANDYKAAAVYGRSHFEKIMKKFCQGKSVAVRFNEQLKKVSANDLWSAIEKASKFNAEENRTKGKSEWIVTDDLIKKINRNSKTLLNEAVHSSSETIHGGEMREAIDAVAELEVELKAILKATKGGKTEDD